MTLQVNEGKIQEIERRITQLQERVESFPLDRIMNKIDSEINMQFAGGKYHKHIREHIDIDNTILGKTERPYSGIILQSPDESSWLITVGNDGVLVITKQ